MIAILQQLGLDQTFYIQFAIVAVVFLALGPIFFKPFMRLIHLRHERLVKDREAAERLVAQAEARFEEYKAKIAAERAAARKEYEAFLLQARREEAEILSSARDEARKITQEAAESAMKQQTEIKRHLEADIDAIARTVSETLLAKRV